METRRSGCLVRGELMRRLTPFALALVVASGIGSAQQHTVEPARDGADQAVSGFSSNGDTQLNDYMRLALDRNPGLSRALAQYRSVLQRLPQVSALPDPMLAFTNYLRTPETRVGVADQRDHPVATVSLVRDPRHARAGGGQRGGEVSPTIRGRQGPGRAAGQDRLLQPCVHRSGARHQRRGAAPARPLREACGVPLPAGRRTPAGCPEVAGRDHAPSKPAGGTEVASRGCRSCAQYLDESAGGDACRQDQVAARSRGQRRLQAALSSWASEIVRRSWRLCSRSSATKSGSSWPARTTGRVSVWARTFVNVDRPSCGFGRHAHRLTTA